MEYNSSNRLHPSGYFFTEKTRSRWSMVHQHPRKGTRWLPLFFGREHAPLLPLLDAIILVGTGTTRQKIVPLVLPYAQHLTTTTTLSWATSKPGRPLENTMCADPSPPRLKKRGEGDSAQVKVGKWWHAVDAQRNGIGAVWLQVSSDHPLCNL